MVGLESLSVRDFRNIEAVDLVPASGLTVFQGQNGAGKTSILEAIHVLCRARPFYAVSLDRLVRRGAPGFLVRGVVSMHGGRHGIGIERQEGRTRARLNGQDVRTLSELAALLPVQVLNTRSQEFLTTGPGVRRSFLNWSVFHVEHGFRVLWQRYERALRQRNVAIRQGAEAVADSWVPELAKQGEAIHQGRLALLSRLEPFWSEELASAGWDTSVTWRYQRGWPASLDLEAVLYAGREQERRLGYTAHGPHRADLRFRCEGADAAAYLSRGQQKRVVMALKLAMTRLLMSEGEACPLLLIDDLAAELDEYHREAVLCRAMDTGAQVMATCIDGIRVPETAKTTRWFHVEQGRVTEMI